ncbi:hypothetical protein [Herbidospora sp. RD11066]
MVRKVLRESETEKLNSDVGGDFALLRAVAMDDLKPIFGNCPEESEAYSKSRQRIDAVAAGLAGLAPLSPLAAAVGVALLAATFALPFWLKIFPVIVLVCVPAIFVLAIWYRSSVGLGVGFRWLPEMRHVILDEFQEFAVARHALVGAIRERDLATLHVRYLINEARKGRLTQEFAVTGVSGLAEIYDLAHHVPTAAETELLDVLRHLKGGSVGVAGPRGVGKSSLVRARCRAGVRGSDIACLVAAPVDYVAREFVLHLFASLCRSVLSYTRRPRYLWRLVRYVFGISAISAIFASPILFFWNSDIPTGVRIAVWAFFGTAVVGINVALIHDVAVRLKPERLRRRLRKAARRNLLRVRYLQTLSWTTSETYKPASSGPVGLGIDLMTSRGLSRAEQPFTYPELVGEFRFFARRAAVLADYWDGRLIIGVDELDKIGTAAQAEKFINEIKTVFGIPNAYFFVTVSDDALTAFDRRGLQLRDAFDSAFDEIVRVPPLTYEESRRLLYQRVIGLSEPYVALCHVLSGGLPRELIRAARHLVTVAEETNRMAPVVRRCVRDDLRRKAEALAQLPQVREDASFLRVLRTLKDDSLLADLIHAIGAECAPTSELRREFMTCVYFAHTLEEVFGDDLDENSVGAGGPRFDGLAQARAALAVNTEYTWQLISDCRTSWGRSPFLLPPAV